MNTQQHLEQQVIRQQFEEDAAALGFDLTRTERNVGGEPWSDYVDQQTGHRWGGWLAIAQREPVGTPSSIRDAYALEEMTGQRDAARMAATQAVTVIRNALTDLSDDDTDGAIETLQQIVGVEV